MHSHCTRPLDHVEVWPGDKASWNADIDCLVAMLTHELNTIITIIILMIFIWSYACYKCVNLLNDLKHPAVCLNKQVFDQLLALFNLQNADDCVEVSVGKDGVVIDELVDSSWRKDVDPIHDQIRQKHNLPTHPGSWMTWCIHRSFRLHKWFFFLSVVSRLYLSLDNLLCPKSKATHWIKLYKRKVELTPHLWPLLVVDREIVGVLWCSGTSPTANHKPSYLLLHVKP